MPVLLAQSFLFTFSTESSKRIVRHLARFLYHPHPWTTASLNLFRHPSSFCIEALLCHNRDLVLTQQGFKDSRSKASCGAAPWPLHFSSGLPRVADPLDVQTCSGAVNPHGPLIPFRIPIPSLSSATGQLPHW